ncbi:MAG TPA: cysteine desulfurase family protein [Acidimicrobiia bacterium]|nr:cysteine desulfurase family protein [Acidimicrobiia bacterium]
MRAYLDHASTSPLRPIALDAMLPYLREHFGDPGRLHHEGRVTRVALETAREQVAAFLGARPREIVFTSGGTEAVNTAVGGAVARHVMHAPAGAGRPRIVTTAVEHSSVLDACRREPVDVTECGVDRLGRFDPTEIAEEIVADTALVSVQLANHEVGTVQDVAAVTAAAGDHDAVVHVDACAALGHIPVDFASLDADLMSVTAHKLGGPAGVGALVVRRGLRIPPLLVGGAQERARRAGLENVAAIVGFGAVAGSLDDAARDREANQARRQTSRILEAATALDGVSQLGDAELRLPHIVCLGIDDVEAEPVLLGLDQRGLAVHSGSSCSSESLEPSPVLAAMGVDADRSLRISVGWSTGDDDVERFGGAFGPVVRQLRTLRG